MLEDIFENTILCKACQAEMHPINIVKNGFSLRAIECPACKKQIIHPHDEAEFLHFNQLKNKTFKVKLRFVGNSYAVSIPKEIVTFMREQEKAMNDMVRLCFQDMKKLNLIFD